MKREKVDKDDVTPVSIPHFRFWTGLSGGTNFHQMNCNGKRLSVRKISHPMGIHTLVLPGIQEQQATDKRQTRGLDADKTEELLKICMRRDSK